MNTVLHIAAEQGHVELVEKIIRRDNTLLTSQNSRQETPLHLAARAGNRFIISLIVLLAQESGIGAYDVLTKRSTAGDTVLHEAARHGHEDTVRVLMTVAPALSAEVNSASLSPLYLAVVRKSVGVVKSLLQYSHASAVGPNQKNALHAAVLASRDLTSMLLDWNSELANQRDTSGSTPLHYAASDGDVNIVKIFLEKVPSTVYIRDEEGSSPLHVAAQMRHYSSITSMIDHCPDSFEIREHKNALAGTTATLSAYGAIFSPQRQDKLKRWEDEATKWIDRTSKNLIIVSVLIATIAFSAAFNVPGSYHENGVANLCHKPEFHIFLVLDTIALSASVSATMLLVVAKAVSKRFSWISFSLSLWFFWTSLFTMQLAFVMAVQVALGKGKPVTKSIIFFISITFFTCTVQAIYKSCSPTKLGTLRKFLSSREEKTQTTRQIDIQFPKSISYVRGLIRFIFLIVFFYEIALIIFGIAPFFYSWMDRVRPEWKHG